MKKILVLLLISSQAWAGFPPTTVKGTNDTNPVVTFNHRFGANVDHNGTTDYQPGSDNALLNAGFELPTLGSAWTATKLSGTTFTAAVDASNAKKGAQSALLTWTSATGEFCQTTTSIAQTNGMAMVSAMWVKSALTDVSVCANVGGVDIQCNTYSGAGNWQMVPVTYTGPSNGTAVGVCVKNTNSETGTANADEAFVGSIQSPQGALGQVSQAQLYGEVKFTCTTRPAVSGAASYTAFSAPGTCTYTAYGNASAPSTNVPGIKFSSLPPGDYKVELEGSIHQTVSGQQTLLNFSDGTNAAREESQVGNVLSIYPGVSQTISYTTAQSNITLQLLAKTGSSGGVELEPDVGSITVRVYRYPSSEIAYRPDVLPASWSGYHTVSGGWSTTSATYADFAAGTSPTLNQITARGITCSTAGGSLAGISCTLTRTGMHRVCATPTLTDTGAADMSLRLVDGSGTIINPGQGVNSAGASSPASSQICGTYNATSVSSAITFKIQGATDAGTMSIRNTVAAGGAAIQWTVDATDASNSSPLLMGSVTSTSTGQEHTERFSFGGSGGSMAAPTSCTTGSCTIYKSSFSPTVTWNSTGNYTFGFPSGEYAGIATCQITPTNWAGASAGCNCNRTAGTSTSLTYQCICAGSSQNIAADVQCEDSH